MRSGENIEPQPIEDAVCVSPFIKFCTVVGNDCKHLGALVVPDQDAIAEHFSGACEAEMGFRHINESVVMRSPRTYPALQKVCGKKPDWPACDRVQCATESVTVEHKSCTSGLTSRLHEEFAEHHAPLAMCAHLSVRTLGHSMSCRHSGA